MNLGTVDGRDKESGTEAGMRKVWSPPTREEFYMSDITIGLAVGLQMGEVQE